MKGRLPISVAEMIASPSFGANGERADPGFYTPIPGKTAGKRYREDSRR
jgi:hypothetical protein